MSNVATSTVSAKPASSRWSLGLWVGQVLLAGLFGLSGLMKTTMAPAALAKVGLAYAVDIPHALLLFIGVCELAGALGVILPAATRILPFLTPLAALGFAVIQVLAIAFHFVRGELGEALPLNLVLLALSFFVALGADLEDADCRSLIGLADRPLRRNRHAARAFADPFRRAARLRGGVLDEER